MKRVQNRLERLENAPGIEPVKPWLTIHTLDEQTYFRSSPWFKDAEPIQAEELEEILRTHQVIVMHYVKDEPENSVSQETEN